MATVAEVDCETRRRARLYRFGFMLIAGGVLGRLLVSTFCRADPGIAWRGLVCSALVVSIGWSAYIRASRSHRLTFLLVPLTVMLPYDGGKRRSLSLNWGSETLTATFITAMLTILIVGLALLVERAFADRFGKPPRIAEPMWDADADRLLAAKGPL